MERRFLPRLRFSTVLGVSLLAILLAACSPTGSAPSATLPPLSPTVETSAQASAAPTPAALPVATSRGPNLEATDPETVRMASGGLQVVEFFEFW